MMVGIVRGSIVLSLCIPAVLFMGCSNSPTAENKGNDDLHAIYSFNNKKSVGDVAVAAAQTFDDDDYTMAAITVDTLLTGGDAERFLKDSLKEDYKEPEVDMSWNVIRYSSTLSFEDGYIDIRIEGLDGGKLVLNGKAYPKRTYDLFDYVKQDGNNYVDYYCYYLVPDGCNEYLLEMGIFGNESIEARMLNDFYDISLTE